MLQYHIALKSYFSEKKCVNQSTITGKKMINITSGFPEYFSDFEVEKAIVEVLGSTSNKKNVFFRALPEKGGETPARIC